MPRKKTPGLTESELRLLEALRQKDSAIAAEIADALPKQLDLAYNTVLSAMRIRAKRFRAPR